MHLRQSRFMSTLAATAAVLALGSGALALAATGGGVLTAVSRPQS
jgi:hypothetical protein